jgi:hypothetical protein
MPNSIVPVSKAPIMKSAIALPVRVPWKFADRVSARLNSNTGLMNSYPHFSVWFPVLNVIVSFSCQL